MSSKILSNEDITFEEGREGIWVDVSDSRMSPWHQVALNDGWVEKASLRTTNPKAKMKQWIFVN